MIDFYHGPAHMLKLMSEQDLGCFGAHYGDARQRFLAGQQHMAPTLVHAQQSFPHPLPGPQQEPLACDVLQLGQRATPQQLLVLISGTHGVEGFAGSAIQCDCLPLLEPALQANASLGVVVIHALNPWGFAWLRRYDHEGIDLNRNFVDFAASLPANPDYDRLHARLLAADTLTPDTLPQLYPDMDLATFTAAVTGGQYQHRDGLFYGGSAPSWSRTILEEITVAPVFASAERIAVIDLHTGLGPYGYGEVINDHSVHSDGFNQALAWYGDNAQSTELGESVSSRKQGLLDYHWHDVIQARGCFVTLEFGSFDRRRLLTALINEQVLHNRLSQSERVRDIDHEAVQALKRFFYPEEHSWQQQVLFRGRQVTDLALRGLLA
jgi:hypothetical protein